MGMRLVICFLVALFLLVVQGALHQVGLPAWLIPQGVLVCVVFLAFYEFSLAGVVMAFLLGLSLDMSSGVLLGPWAGSYVVVYAILAFLSQRLFVESALVAMLVVASATVIAGVLFLLLAFEYQAVTREDFLLLVGQAFASALIAPFVFRYLLRSWRKVGVSFGRRAGVVSVV
jgi:rod shape-determining protein MreD